MPIDTSFKGTAKLLSDSDISAAAESIGVPEVNLRAVISVETSGKGFDSQGRPKMLFEPHIFYRNLASAKQTNAVDLGLAYSTWGQQRYPADSYPRLVQAVAIDEVAALKSCSWGLGQIMGENFPMLRYTTVEEMVLAAEVGELEQLEQMLGFLTASHGAIAALESGNWAAFARIYNGPSYAQNHYDTKLAAYVAAHKSLSTAALPLPPPPPPLPPPPPPPLPPLPSQAVLDEA
jgi:hypothetical protein